MPPWIQAENISWYEQSELNILKCFTYVPVVITFGVFAFLLIYYVAVGTTIPLLCCRLKVGLRANHQFKINRWQFYLLNYS